MHFLFKDCVLDPERRELTRASEAVAVGPQVFDLLLFLIRNRERVVSKDDLLDAVWDGRIVSESTLTSHINAVRKAIGDAGNTQQLIRTVPRKGFRFIGDVKEANSANDLGVGYVLEGSMRKAAGRVRITGQLIDASTGAQLWAERFEGTLDDIFELQDRIAAGVAGAIAPRVELAEIERAKRKPTGSLNAYDLYLRGVAHVHRGTRESIEQALPLFKKAIELDPNYAAAHAMAGWCYFWRRVNGWCADRATETEEGAWLARRAVELGRDDAVALTRGAHALAHLAGDLDAGIALLDRAVFLNPNFASAWFLGGFLRTWHGESESAIAHFERAMRLNPLDPELYRMQAGIGMAHLFAGRIEAASHWAELSYRNLPSFLMVVALIAATRALSGRITGAQQAVAQLRELDSSIRISNLKDWLPIRRREDFVIFSEGLRLAGLPER